ncbi:MAG: peptidylprolyl isomerase [Eubacteriaceae bacterium]|jgi:peptidyl-prolyl cis-trans isomerase B (cyclophilin B)
MTVENNPKVILQMKDGNQIEIELYPEVAPETVKNFLKLVNEGFYNGLIFHRVIPGFMIQGGDPTGTGMGGPGHTIHGEFASNGFANDMKHKRGVISMARSMDKNSAGSQFFIMTSDAPHLDGDYAAFGKVISGIEEADKIVGQKRDAMDKPLEDQIIEKAWEVK